jgi:hypothetical protein
MSKRPPEVFRRDNTAVIKVAHDRSLSRKALKDQEAAIERRRRVGPSFDKMTKILNVMLNGQATCAELRRFATVLGGARGLKLDRLAKRTKECLICWFCEHFPQLLTNHQLDRFDQGPERIPSPASPGDPHRPNITRTPTGIWCGVRLMAPPPYRDSTSQPTPSPIPTNFGELEWFDPLFYSDITGHIDINADDDADSDVDVDE